MSLHILKRSVLLLNGLKQHQDTGFPVRRPQLGFSRWGLLFSEKFPLSD